MIQPREVYKWRVAFAKSVDLKIGERKYLAKVVFNTGEEVGFRYTTDGKYTPHLDTEAWEELVNKEVQKRIEAL